MSKSIRKSNKGFTLIELMIVVAIIGILAAIAIPNFLRFQLKSKSSEGKVNIAAIRTAEESYLAEFGAYVATATENPLVASVGTTKTPFLNTPGIDFDLLGWAPEGSVFFSYSTVAQAAPAAYSIQGQADIDGDGVLQAWGYVKTIPGGVVGMPIGQCVATGIAGGVNPATQTERDTVGPCVAGHGQSVF
ncbi:MAG TPA: prepilin-type N-terminal cleavage/methylation domain-containing protein [Deltaproteobacteria bacterium]|nr:prepilin-type N-terminal cleavage/methylation domain-containing protein [Deltaproteobacteria bacterium]